MAYKNSMISTTYGFHEQIFLEESGAGEGNQIYRVNQIKYLI